MYAYFSIYQNNLPVINFPLKINTLLAGHTLYSGMFSFSSTVSNYCILLKFCQIYLFKKNAKIINNLNFLYNSKFKLKKL